MGARVHLHIGLQKSGTTYLQHALHERSDALLANGVLYPNAGRRVQVPNHQLRLLRAAPRGLPLGRVERGRARCGELAAPAPRGSRGQPVGAAVGRGPVVPGPGRRAPGRGRARRVPRWCAPIVTARSLDRLVTSAWQQNVRSGDGTGLETFLRARAGTATSCTPAVTRPRLPPVAGVRARCPGRPLERRAGPQAVTVVVNPASRPSCSGSGSWTRSTCRPAAPSRRWTCHRTVPTGPALGADRGARAR